MTFLRPLVAVFAALVISVSAYAQVTTDQLVGTWSAEQMDGEPVPEGMSFVATFAEDGTGTLVVSFGPEKEEMTMTWAFNDDGNLDLTMKDPEGNEEETVTLESEMDGDKLKLWEEGSDGEEAIFVRVDE